MLEAQGSQSFHSLWSDLLSTAPQLVERVLHIPSIPEHNDIDQPGPACPVDLPVPDDTAGEAHRADRETHGERHCAAPLPDSHLGTI